MEYTYTPTHSQLEQMSCQNQISAVALKQPNVHNGQDVSWVSEPVWTLWREQVFDLPACGLVTIPTEIKQLSNTNNHQHKPCLIKAIRRRHYENSVFISCFHSLATLSCCCSILHFTLFKHHVCLTCELIVFHNTQISRQSDRVSGSNSSGLFL